MGRMKRASSPLTPLNSRIWLHFLRFCSPLWRPLSLTVLREVCLYLSSLPLLVSLSGTKLLLFSFHSQSSSQQRLDFQFKPGSMVCLTDADCVVCIAGNDSLRRCFEVSLKDYAMERREDLRVTRAWPGVVLYQGVVYVFGGVGYNTSSECFGNNHWTALPDMHIAKHSFTPTPYGRHIYLCAPQAGTQLEVFSAHIPSYELLPLTFPFQCSSSVSLLLRDLVVVLTSEGEGLRWRVGEQELKQKGLKCGRLEWLRCWGNVVRSQTCAYWMTGAGTIVKYEMGENVVSLYGT